MATSEANFKQSVSVEVIRASMRVNTEGYLKIPVKCNKCGNDRRWLIRCESCGDMEPISLEEKS